MKFKFRLEPVLKHRLNNKRVAEKIFAEALMALQQEERLKQKMEDDMLMANQSRFEVQKEGGQASSFLSSVEGYVVGQRVRIKRQEEVIENHKAIVEEKRNLLVAAEKEFRILEKLKQKGLLDFKKEQKKREAKDNDEMITTRHGRRRLA